MSTYLRLLASKLAFLDKNLSEPHSGLETDTEDSDNRRRGFILSNPPPDSHRRGSHWPYPPRPKMAEDYTSMELDPLDIDFTHADPADETVLDVLDNASQFIDDGININNALSMMRGSAQGPMSGNFTTNDPRVIKKKPKNK